MNDPAEPRYIATLTCAGGFFFGGIRRIVSSPMVERDIRNYAIAQVGIARDRTGENRPTGIAVAFTPPLPDRGFRLKPRKPKLLPR